MLTVRPRTVEIRRSALPALQREDSEFASRGARRPALLRATRLRVRRRAADRALAVVGARRETGGETARIRGSEPRGDRPRHRRVSLRLGRSVRRGSGWVPERFEAAVEVAASYAVAHADRSERMYVVTPTTRGAAVTTAGGGAADSFLDAFAAVRGAARRNGPRGSRPARPANALPVADADHGNAGAERAGRDASGGAGHVLADRRPCGLARPAAAARSAPARRRGAEDLVAAQ